MGLGATLIGAIIGAAVGVGLHQFLEVGLQMEASWFFIVIGLLTGLGVRQANKSLAGKVSYVRGAISGLVALAAIVGSIYLVSILMAKRDTTSSKPLAEAAPAATAEDNEAGDAATDETPAPATQPEARPAVAPGGVGKMGGRAEEFSTWQFVFMAVGAFVAYEFGRGSGPRTPHPAPEASGEPVVYTDPSN